MIADVYEASSRVGGRCTTGRGDFADSQIYEHGGELIDTGHRAIRNLAGELGLELDNLLKAEKKGTEQLGNFFGRRYTLDQMVTDFQAVLPQMTSDVDAAGYPTQYTSYTQRGYELDHMSSTTTSSSTSPAAIVRRSVRCSTSPTTSSTAPRRRSRARSTCST